MSKYRNNPVGYMRKVLGIQPWSKQEEIARLTLIPPYKVHVKAGHSVGKTHCMAALTSWRYDCFDPGCVITTAPTHRDVCDLLWREVRIQRQRAGLGGFVGTSAPELRSSHDHYAKGFTASRGESFQGRHQESMLFIFDEAVGVDAVFWQTTKTMFQGNGNHAWVTIFNPTDTASQAYQEEQARGLDGKPAWHVVTMSVLDHPNIRPEPGLPDYPGAVSVVQVNDWVADWCEPIPPNERISTDLEWPFDSGQWFRPGPLFECRALGRWPSQGTYGVWSDLLWSVITRQATPLPVPGTLPEIGCDVARHGDDFTAIHVRWGMHSVHHERHSGWGTDQTAGRLKQLCEEYAAKAQRTLPGGHRTIRPQEILVKVDGDGIGGAVIDQRGEFNFASICASARAYDSSRYPNRRSELWFATAALARNGTLNISSLPTGTQEILRGQAMAPMWKVDNQGRCAVEPKDITKSRLKASPDDMDAMNLAYTSAPAWEPPSFADATPREEPQPKIRYGVDTDDRTRRGGRLFGR